MKKILLALVALSAISATATAHQLVTVQVCDRGESGTQCETIRYVYHPSAGIAPGASDSANEFMVRPAQRHGIPGWLAALNGAYSSHSTGHGNNPSSRSFEAP